MLHNKKIRGSYSSGEVEGDGADEEVSIERILAAGLSRGLRMQDTEEMTLGMWIDYVIEWNNMNRRDDEEDEDPKSRRTHKVPVHRAATQSDFDIF